MDKHFSAPQDFTARFPRYVYRDGKSKETVQWRQAAMDMANDRAKLVEALKVSLIALGKAGHHAGLSKPLTDGINLLSELGEKL